MSKGVLAALSALVALAVGLWLGGHPGDLPGPVRDTFVEEDGTLRAEIIDTIDFPLLVAILMIACIGVSALGSGITLRRFLRV